jgi:Glyoxalase/Bleomycin resistance protein/Dioxygenase superfamily
MRRALEDRCSGTGDWRHPGRRAVAPVLPPRPAARAALSPFTTSARAERSMNLNLGAAMEKTFEGARVTGLVPMVQVADVERSAAFYGHLGFAIGNYVPRTGQKAWAWLYAPDAPDWKRGPNLMITRSESGSGAPAHDVVLYLYVTDLKALRSRLVANGLTPGEITYPDYLPAGECCLKDPDGYTLMMAQVTADTP